MVGGFGAVGQPDASGGTVPIAALRPRTGFSKARLVQAFRDEELLALVREDDDLLRRDRKRMEQVIRERARRAADQLPAESRIEASSLVDSIILSELAAEPIGVLLDVGTGSGILAIALAKFMKNWPAPDRSRNVPKMMKRMT